MLVDQNDRVDPGTVVVRLDRELEVAVAQAEASLEEARANVSAGAGPGPVARYKARGASTKGRLQETLRHRLPRFTRRFATLKSRQASLGLARNNLARGEQLLPNGGIGKEEFDQRNNTLKVAVEQEKEAWAAIQETRAFLGLRSDYHDPLAIPKDLENQQSTVQSAVSQIASSLAEIGIPFDPKDARDAKAFNDFLRPQGDKSAGEGLDKVIDQAPAVKVGASLRFTGQRAARGRQAPTEVGPRSARKSPAMSRIARSTRATGLSPARRFSQSGPRMSGSLPITRRRRSMTFGSECRSICTLTPTPTGCSEAGSQGSALGRGCRSRSCRPRMPLVIT